MRAKFKTLQADLYNVFVIGNANKQQQARVFLMLFIPLYVLYTAVVGVK